MLNHKSVALPDVTKPPLPLTDNTLELPAQIAVGLAVTLVITGNGLMVKSKDEVLSQPPTFVKPVLV